MEDLIPRKERMKMIKLLKEFLPTIELTYEDFITRNQFERKAILQAFRAWLYQRRKT